MARIAIGKSRPIIGSDDCPPPLSTITRADGSIMAIIVNALTNPGTEFTVGEPNELKVLRLSVEDMASLAVDLVMVNR